MRRKVKLKTILIIIFLILNFFLIPVRVGAKIEPNYCTDGTPVKVNTTKAHQYNDKTICCPFSISVSQNTPTYGGQCKAKKNIEKVNYYEDIIYIDGDGRFIGCAYQAKQDNLYWNDDSGLCYVNDTHPTPPSLLNTMFIRDDIITLATCNPSSTCPDPEGDINTCYEYAETHGDSRICCPTATEEGCDSATGWCPLDKYKSCPASAALASGAALPNQATCSEICAGEAKQIEWKKKTGGQYIQPKQIDVLVKGAHWDECINCICREDPAKAPYSFANSTFLNENVWTEIGCVTATESGVIASLMRIVIGVISALAILRFVQAGMLLNNDDPEKIKEGKSIAMSALMAIVAAGLIPLILNFVGVEIFNFGEIFNLT